MLILLGGCSGATHVIEGLFMVYKAYVRSEGCILRQRFQVREMMEGKALVACKHGMFLHYTGIVGKDVDEVKERFRMLTLRECWSGVVAGRQVRLEKNGKTYDCFLIVGGVKDEVGVFHTVPKSVGELFDWVSIDAEFVDVSVVVIPLANEMSNYEGLKASRQWAGSKLTDDLRCKVSIKNGSFSVNVSKIFGEQYISGEGLGKSVWSHNGKRTGRTVSGHYWVGPYKASREIGTGWE